MSSPESWEVDDLMAIADAVGVTAHPHPEAGAKILLHPSLRGLLADDSLEELLTDWSYAAAGIDPDAPVDVIPVDAAWLDRIPPADLDVCEACTDGVVEVLVEGMVVDRQCSWCRGTGERSRS
jgi:hypothetical protein